MTAPGFRVDWSKAEILCTFCGGSLATEGEDEASAVASVSSYHHAKDSGPRPGYDPLDGCGYA